MPSQYIPPAASGSGLGDALVADPLSQFAATTSAQLRGVISDETGTGALVFATSPTLVTPALGTPSALVGTNITGTAANLTAGNVTNNANLTGHITSVGNAAVLGSFTLAQLNTAISDANIPVVSDVAYDEATWNANTDAPTKNAVRDAIETLAVGGFDEAGDYTLTGTWDFTSATVALGSLNVGNVDTTITRVSAGVIAVEGVTVVDVSTAQTLTNKTLTSPTLTTPALGTPSALVLTNATGLPAASIVAGILAGNLTLGESTGQIVLDPTLSADGTWSGIQMAGTAGATLAFGDLCYFQASDSRWELVDADTESTTGPLILGMCVLAAASDGDPTNLLLYGKIRADANFPTLTIGAPVYASTTAGDIQVAQPSGADDCIRVIGHGLTADVLMFNPSPDWLVHV